MKFEELHIVCKNIEERDIVKNHLISSGYKFIYSGYNHDDLVVSTYDDGDFQFIKNSAQRKAVSFLDFFGKSTVSLKQKVEQAKSEIGYKSLSKMSYDLGFHYNYLSNTLREGLTPENEAKLIAKLDALLEQNKQELTHNFEGKSLHKHIDDAMMIGKSEYESMKKEIDHKTQIAEKHADMRNKAELRVSDLEILAKDLNHSCDEWKKLFWCVKGNNVELTNSKRIISIWLAVSILIIVAMLASGVLHFNGVV